MNALRVWSEDLWMAGQMNFPLCVALVDEATNGGDFRTGSEAHQEGQNDNNAGDSRI